MRPCRADPVRRGGRSVDASNACSGYSAVVSISVHVRAYGGSVEAQSTHPSIGPMCQLAAESALPMLGYVDPYDDTTFNCSQMRLVIPELLALIERGNQDEADAAREILALAEQVERQAHRYLIFNGD
jgi:hypothetical protein